MEIKVFLNNGDTIETKEGNVDAMGVHYPKASTSKLVVAGKEDEMRICMVPWFSIAHIEYVITPDMVAPQDTGPVPIMSAGDVQVQGTPNRKQRRAGLQG